MRLVWGNVGLADLSAGMYDNGMGVAVAVRYHVTREEHQARMQRAETLLADAGWLAAPAARQLASEARCGERQAWRYIRAVRTIYANAAKASDALPTPYERQMVLLRTADACVQGADPDWKARVKCLELSARMAGLLDTRSHVTIDQRVTVGHVSALDGLSGDALAALAEFHRLAARDKAGATLAIESTATESLDTSEAIDPAGAEIAVIPPADGK